MKITLLSRDGYKILVKKYSYSAGVIMLSGAIVDPDGNEVALEEVTMQVDGLRGWLDILARLDGRSEVSAPDILKSMISKIPTDALKGLFGSIKGIFEVAKAGRK